MRTVMLCSLAILAAGCGEKARYADHMPDRIQSVDYAINRQSEVQAAPAAFARFDSEGSGFSGLSDSARLLLPAVIPASGIVERMMVRTGTIDLRVDTLEVALRRLREVTTLVGAQLVSSQTQSGDGGQRRALATLRVRPEDFDRALEAMRRLGAVRELRLESADIGEEYVDVSARLANGRRLESRLLRLLDARTGKLSDVVAVERELARVRQDVDVLEGRRRYLAAQAAMSTIHVTLNEPSVTIGVPGPGVMRAAAEQSWQNFVWMIALLVRSVGVVVPLGVLAVIAWMLSKRLRRNNDDGAFVSVVRPSSELAAGD